MSKCRDCLMRRPRCWIGCWLVPALLLLLAPAARAETRRVAVIVGNNAGSGEQPPLRYAETDAGKMARVLVELGGVDPADLFLLQGRDIEALHSTLALARGRVAAYQENPLHRVIVIFYFSGHSDGQALELGADRLGFSALRRWLRSTGAEVRLAMVDSCKSGALLAAKGGTPGPAFQIRLTDALASTGEALMTSSAADEIALESREIGGSFFTHHLISGLRGAADASGDGRVTLTEAYQYAYVHTIATTGATVAGPQHPSYDYRLSGQGELVLTELSRPTTMLQVPENAERALIIELVRDQVIAELGADARHTIAVQPGRYAVRAWRAGRGFAGRFTVTAGQTRRVQWHELAALAGPLPRAKGEREQADRARAQGRPERPALLDRRARPGHRNRRNPRSRRDHGPPAPGQALAVAAGAQGGASQGLGALATLRTSVRATAPSGLSLALQLGTGTGAGFRESSAALLGGYRLGLARGPLQVWGGVEAGIGAVFQSLNSSAPGAPGDAGPRAATGALLLGPWAGLSLGVSESLSVAMEGHLLATGLRRDGATTVVLQPAAWLGLVVTL